MLFLFSRVPVVILLLVIIHIFPSSVRSEVDNQQVEKYHSYPEERMFKVGFVPYLPPYQFVRNGEYVGFNIDIMNKIAKEQGFRVEYVPIMSEDKSIEAVRDGTVDILLGVNYTAELSEKVEFTERYVSSSVGVLVPVDSPIQSVEDLHSQTVAIQLNTVEYEFLKNIRNIHYHVAHQQRAAFQILTLDRAAAFVGNRMTAEYLLQENDLNAEYYFIESYLLPLDYSLAVQKGNYRLLHQLNVGIRQFKLTDEYTEIYSEWFGDLETPLGLKLKKIREVLILIIVISVIIFLFGLRWNRQLQREVTRKTKDLQVMNESLKKQVKKTKDSDEFKEQILELSSRGIVTCSKEGMIMSTNSVALEVFDLPKGRKDVLMKEIPFLWNMVKDKVKNVLIYDKAYIREEFETTLPDGEVSYFRYDLKPLYDAEQDILGLLLMFEDITSGKKLKAQLDEQEKSRALIQLVAGIAHEIRNPLTSIKTFVQLIPYKMNNEKFKKEIATHVPNEIDRLNQLVEGLINYAKPHSQSKDVFDVSTVLDFVILLFQREIENKGFRIEKMMEEGLMIEADESQIKQVLINLFLNAIESMEHKRNERSPNRELTLNIHLFKKGNQVVIEVEDEGIGMSQEMVKRVFEPFYTTKLEGTGLGLSLSKQYIDENNGVLSLESVLGEGSKFIMTFPEKTCGDMSSEK